MSKIDFNSLRADFPLLSQVSHGKPFIFLDSAATSAKPESVLNAERQYYEEYGVNIHRGLYEYSAKATKLYQDTREKIATFIGTPEPRSIVFTHGSTESSNLLAYSWGRANLHPGDKVLTTELEHHSTLIPWQEICRQTGATLDFIPYDKKTGTLDIRDLDNQIRTGVKLVVVTGMSNATGYIPPVKAITSIAHNHGALIAVDGAQLVSHHPINVQELDIDFLYFSCHKMLGPTGAGVLYGRLSLLQAMDPFLFGGDMIGEVLRDRSTWAEAPEKLEAGTPNIAGVLGFSAALDYLSAIGMDAIAQYEKELGNYAFERAKATKDLIIYGPESSDIRGGMLSFNLGHIHCHDVGTILDTQGIAVRTGFHCAMPYMKLLGIGGTVRASLYFYNNKADIDRLFEGVEQARSVFS